MSSRRPPSQRDPAYALHRLPGVVQQIATGLRVQNAAPVKTMGPSRATHPGREREAVFSTAIAPVAGQQSPPYPVSGRSAARRFRVFLASAGSSSTVVKLYLNGTEIGSVTLASGAFSGSEAITEALVDGDVLTVAATTVGTDVTGMTAIAYLAA